MEAARRLEAVTRHLVLGEFASPDEQNSAFDTEDTCGIIAYVGTGSALPYLIEGLKILENRGYDSAGISTVDEHNQLKTTKFASSKTTCDAIDRLALEAPPVHGHDSIGMAHTRWATHGAKSDVNAHPHHDCRDRIAIIHNGVIENSSELKQELQTKHGVEFRSETDTEVIAQLIGLYVSQGDSTLDAVKRATTVMHGTWGLVVLDRQYPDQIIACKNGSPLLLGIGQGRMFVASEPSAFAQHTKEFIALDDGEIAVVRADHHNLDVSRVELAEVEAVQLTPAPFEHWTIKEIYDQPEAISKALNYGGRIIGDSHVKLGGLDQNQRVLLGINHLVIAACGTSYHAGLFGGHLMRMLNSFVTVQIVDAAELTRDHFPTEGAGLLVLSQSGETKDVHRALMLAEEMGVPMFSIVNVVRSLIARTTKCGVYLNAGREMAVASTKAFTCQVTVLALVALWFSQKHDEAAELAEVAGISAVTGGGSSAQTAAAALLEGVLPIPKRLGRRKELIEALHRLPTNVGMTIHRIRAQCKAVAEKLIDKKHCFVLGKGLAESIAREGALKIKEITYLHAEGYPGGALKHGPFALIDHGTPVVLLILSDTHAGLMETALEEVRSRGAMTIVITDLPKKYKADEVLRVPSNGVLTSLLATIPLQLVAYELALLRDINPDKPRHLAKAVTVD